MKYKILLVAAITCIGLSAADSPQFRGPTRNGVFPENGLLKSWPESGPQELWSTSNLGEGYASVAVKDGHVYTTGKFGEDGFAFALNMKGELKWKTHYGREFHGSGFPGARSTPTIDGNSVYVISSYGELVCLDAGSGKINWKIDTLAKFSGSKSEESMIPRWGISESVLIDGDNVICTPGGENASLVAVNKNTGETVWTTEGLSDISGYCSARIFDNGKHRQIITMTGKAMVGVSPVNGSVLWRQPYPASYDIHAISPVFHGDMIYVSDGYDQGGTMFKLNNDGKGVSQAYKEGKLDAHHGGVVLVDGHIYGAANSRGWLCIEAETGEVKAQIRSVGKGSVAYADGMIYGYGEKGLMGLMNADPNNFELVSSFKVTKGSGQHWAHPVISGGVLYLRHGDALMAYNIKK